MPCYGVGLYFVVNAVLGKNARGEHGTIRAVLRRDHSESRNKRDRPITASGVRERAKQSAKPRAVTENDPEKDLRSKIERTW